METSLATTSAVPVLPLLTENHISDDREEALRVLAAASTGLRVATHAALYFRVILGMQLAVIQNLELWRDDGDTSFDSWMKNSLPRHCGLATAAGYSALRMGKSNLLTERVGIRNLGEFRNMQNAMELVKLESRGEPVTTLMIENAKTLPMAQFRASVLGKTPESMVATPVDSHRKARAMTEIVEKIKEADAEALERLCEILDEVMPVAGGNPTDIADYICSAVEHALHGDNQSDSKILDVDFVEMDEENEENE